MGDDLAPLFGPLRRKTKGAVEDQAETTSVSPRQIMSASAFRDGVADVRAGMPTRFDDFDDDWAYERGRQFAFIAPMSMPLRIGRRLNTEAVWLFTRALVSGEIL